MSRTVKLFILIAAVLFALSAVKLSGQGKTGGGADTAADPGGEKPYGASGQYPDDGSRGNAVQPGTAADGGVIPDGQNGQKGYAYLLKSENGRVMLYFAGNDRIPVETAISYPDLPPEDRALLDSGIAVENERQLLSVIEDYTS